MCNYTQLSLEERYTMCGFLAKAYSITEIAKALNRSPSTLYRELARNKRPHNGFYAASVANSYAHGRLRRERRGSQFSKEIWELIYSLLKKKWSPEQIQDNLAVVHKIKISIQTIYRHIRKDRRKGGILYQSLRIMPKIRRKSYGSKDSRGRLAGKKSILIRPLEANTRAEVGHWGLIRSKEEIERNVF